MGGPCQCMFKACKNRYDSKNISFFRFPRNLKLFNSWCDLCGRPELKARFSKELRLCMDHFDSNSIKVNMTGRKYLVRNALPKDHIVLNVPSKSRPIDKRIRPLHSKQNIDLIPFVRVLESSNNNYSSLSLSFEDHEFDCGGGTLNLASIDHSPTKEEALVINIEQSIHTPASIFDQEISTSAVKELPTINISEVNNSPSLQKETSVGDHVPESEPSCREDKSFCRHYVSLNEEKAKSYKLQREVETMKQENDILKKREEILLKKLKSLESQLYDAKRQLNYNDMDFDIKGELISEMINSDY